MKRLLAVGATAMVGMLGLSQPASAGNILITGHDADAHNATLFGTWGLNYLLNDGNGSARTDASARIGILGNTNTSAASYLGPYDNFFFYDLDSPTWTNAFTDNNATLVVLSGMDYVSAAGSSALNAQSAAFASYFNAGGTLFVHTEQGLGQTYYGFIPSFGGTQSNSLPGCTTESGTGACMAPTAAGTAAGHTIAQIVSANITHTRFTGVDPVFTVLSIYNNNGGAGTGSAISFGLIGGSIDGGGFGTDPGTVPVPEPTFVGLLGVSLVVALRRRRH